MIYKYIKHIFIHNVLIVHYYFLDFQYVPLKIEVFIHLDLKCTFHYYLLNIHHHQSNTSLLNSYYHHLK